MLFRHIEFEPQYLDSVCLDVGCFYRF